MYISFAFFYVRITVVLHTCVFYGCLNLIRTLGILRSRFESLHGAFNGCLIPPKKTDTRKKKGLKATLSRNYDDIPLHKGKEIARFAQLWNKIITTCREEDVANNRLFSLKNQETYVLQLHFLYNSYISSCVPASKKHVGREFLI